MGAVWGLADYRDAYASGASVVDVIDGVLAALACPAVGLLIGEPLHGCAVGCRTARRRCAGLAGRSTAVAVRRQGHIDGRRRADDGRDVPGSRSCDGRDLGPSGCPFYAVRAAGAVVVGKTNLDQFRNGAGRHPLAVRHAAERAPPPISCRADRAPAPPWPWRSASCRSRSATDTAGSGRVPAALNGIVGLKPTTQGQHRRHRARGAAIGLSVDLSPRGVEDAQAVLEVIAGPDPATR